MRTVISSSSSSTTTKNDENDNFDDSIVYLGITACMSVLLIGICLVYSLRLVAQRFPKFPKIPDPWVFYVCGIMIAILLQYGGGTTTITKVIEVVDASFPDLFFALLLPPIIFESGYSLQTKEFAATFTPALVYAGPGTLIAAFLIGLTIYVSGQIHIIYNFSFLDSLLLGTMASATDTVSILATMANSPSNGSTSNSNDTNSAVTMKIIPRYIYSLVYGESVLNDAIALVLFRTLSGYTKWDVTFLSILAGCGGFFVVFIGSTFIGILVASLAALLFKYGTLRSRVNGPSSIVHSSSSVPVHSTHAAGNDQQLLATTAAEVERSLYCVIPFLSYMLAEGLQLSGVVATLFCGILMGKTAQFNVSKNTRNFAAGLFRMLASLFESLVFVYIGIATTQLSKFGISNYYWSTALILLISCLIGRAGGISISTWIINRIPTVETIHRASSGIRSSALSLSSSPPTIVTSVPSTTISSLSPSSVTNSPNFFPLVSSPVGAFASSSRSSTVVSRVHQSIRNLPRTIQNWWTNRSHSSSSSSNRITKEQSILLWWCGPRGGVSFALAMHAKSYVVTDTVAGDIMPISMLFVAIVSLIFVPPFIIPLAQKLDLLEVPSSSSSSSTTTRNDGKNNSPDDESLVASLSSPSSSELKTTLLQSSSTDQPDIIIPATLSHPTVPETTENSESNRKFSAGGSPTTTTDASSSNTAAVTIENRILDETNEDSDKENTDNNKDRTNDTKNNGNGLLAASVRENYHRYTGEEEEEEEEEEMLPSPTAVMIATAAKVADRMNMFTDRAIAWLTVQKNDEDEE